MELRRSLENLGMKEHFEEGVAFRGTSEHGAGAAIGWYLLKFRL